MLSDVSQSPKDKCYQVPKEVRFLETGSRMGGGGGGARGEGERGAVVECM